MIVGAKAACGAVVQFFAQLISVRRINHEFDDVALVSRASIAVISTKARNVSPKRAF